MIEFYDFGIIIINGKRYTNDIIVFPNRVRDKWWRREGHKLTIEDLEEVLKTKPQTIVIGTGYSGLLKVPNKVKQQLDNRSIGLVIEKTGDAVKIFNKLEESGEKVAAAFHLTC